MDPDLFYCTLAIPPLQRDKDGFFAQLMGAALNDDDEESWSDAFSEDTDIERIQNVFGTILVSGTCVYLLQRAIRGKPVGPNSLSDEIYATILMTYLFKASVENYLKL